METNLFSAPFMQDLRHIQYKILHQFLVTNKFLYKIKIVASQMCPFCAMYIEDLEHVLYNCNLVKKFWFEVASIWNKLNSVYFTPSLSNITFGTILHDIEKRNQDIDCLLHNSKNVQLINCRIMFLRN